MNIKWFAVILSVFLAFILSPLKALTLPDSLKQKAYLKMRYVNEDGQPRVYFRLYTRNDSSISAARFTIVNLFLEEETRWGMMGNITTDSFGEGYVPLRDRFAEKSRLMPRLHFLGSMKDDPRLAETQTKITIIPARLSLSIYQKDSIHYAKAVLKEKDSTGAWVPALGVKVDFYVTKYFTLLPSAVTDENGEAILELPRGLKGDDSGKIKIAARIDANDNYGTLIATAKEDWGGAIGMDFQERLLSIVLVIGVLAVIISFIRQIFKSKSVN